MKRNACCFLVLLLIAGCAQPKAPAPPVPGPGRPDPATAAPPLVHGVQPTQATTAAVVRETVSGGFRLGPFGQVKNLRWLDNTQVYAAFLHPPGETLGTVSLAGGYVQPLVVKPSEPFYINEPVLGGTSVVYSDAGAIWLKVPGADSKKLGQGWLPNVSPDGTRVVGYGRSGRGYLNELHSGKGQALDVPATSGGPGSDFWSPDSQRYLVQGRPGEPVPGFYFFDAAGEPTGRFTEPGSLSFSAAWSPDAEQVAFLSLPLKLGEDAPSYDGLLIPVAPRLGILDVAAGQAKYFSVPGSAFRGPILWSPDGRKIAVTASMQVAGEAGLPEVRGGSVYVADLAADTISPIIAPTPPNRTLQAVAWSPDSRSLLYVTGATNQPNIYAVSDGGVLPGRSIWLDGERLLTVLLTAEEPRQARLYLTDRNGKVLQTLAIGSVSEINWLTLSPDGQQLAFALRTQGQREGEYLMVLQIE